MESVEVRTSSPVSADVRLMMSHSTSEYEAFPAAAAEENRPTEKQNKRKKKKGIRAFFRRIGKAISHIFGCYEDDMVSPFPRSDPTDVQPDLSGIKLNPSGIELPVNADPEPSPVPGPSGLGPAFEKRKKNSIRAFLRRFQKGNKVAPDWFADEPVAHQDPADQTDPEPLSVSSPSSLDSGIAPDVADPGPSYYERTSDPYPDDLRPSPVPGPSGLVPVAKQDPADSQSGSVSIDSQLTLDSVSSYYEWASDSYPDDPEPKPVPGARDVEPVPSPSVYRPDTGTVSSFYEIKSELGRGAFGIVFEGTCRSNGQKVAVKFLRKKSWDRLIELPGSTKPLVAEVAVNLLMPKPPRSPHIVQMLDWFDLPDQYVLIMEYPHPCVTLLKFVINNGGLLDEPVGRGLMRQAVRAAKHIVDRGIDHGDIHWCNILVNTETLQIKFIDFGSSKLFKTSEDRELVVQSTVRSLGKVLLEIVSGCQEICVLQSGRLDPLRECLSNECKDLIRKCLDSDPTSLTLEQMLEHPWFEQD